MGILQDKKIAVALALIVMIVGTIAYFSTNAYLEGLDEEQFIKEMILHHEEAVDSSMIMLNSNNPSIQTLAQDIVEVQEKEILMLESWLDEWYNMDNKENSDEMGYAGMMPDLPENPSNIRDVVYLKGMIKHHEEAISMAKKVLKTDPRTEVRKMAEDIISVQSQEIINMRAMLENLNGVLI